MRPKSKAASPAEKAALRAAVVKEYLAGEGTLREVAESRGLPHSTVYAWVKAAGADLGQYRTKKVEEAADEVAAYLVESLRAVRTQTSLLGDKVFLETAEPERIKAVATAQGILADKAFRILEAVERAADEQQQRLLGSGTQDESES